MYRSEGGKYLETYRTPQLTWQEVKAMKGRGTVGLGAAGEVNGYGESGPPPLRQKRLGGGASGGGGGGGDDYDDDDDADDGDDDEDTDRAMLGAGGDDGLTAEEAAGLIMNGGGGGGGGTKRGRVGPSLPPDQLRTAHHAAESRAAGNAKYLPTNTNNNTMITSTTSTYVSVQPPQTPGTVSAQKRSSGSVKRADVILGAGTATTKSAAEGEEEGGSTASASSVPAFTVQNMDDMD